MNTQLLVLQLLSKKDMYGYEMIEKLRIMSDSTFDLKVGTLYPILHKLEIEGNLISYEKKTETNKLRKYYSITKKGEEVLGYKKTEWNKYMSAMQKILRGKAYD
ncbi:hypothetical protein AN639_08850 [Candidatus Epulonipiscium fishelsonii]|uniref:Uncharacterized protein n=1 Tax=Candidatus Epulonipiscium fishelsonii TaxID=77094 RepID=A0ACC8XDQ9_9FIRM|nr:hypothetical protein AN639_08850 [Epulopiscium sp. SCG-B05WGA-EpuloA1]ONI40955.1 hypothetical protein AN396_04135 [Epulopiscium sp. SCG-B11WGA-EpuloA1]